MVKQRNNYIWKSYIHICFWIDQGLLQRTLLCWSPVSSCPGNSVQYTYIHNVLSFLLRNRLSPIGKPSLSPCSGPPQFFYTSDLYHFPLEEIQHRLHTRQVRVFRSPLIVVIQSKGDEIPRCGVSQLFPDSYISHLFFSMSWYSYGVPGQDKMIGVSVCLRCRCIPPVCTVYYRRIHLYSGLLHSIHFPPIDL